MGLQANSVHVRLRKSLVNESWYLGPVTFDVLRTKRAINVQPRVTLDADVVPVRSFVDYDRLHDAAVREDRVTQFLGRRGTLRIIIRARNVERQGDLIVRGLA